MLKLAIKQYENELKSKRMEKRDNLSLIYTKGQLHYAEGRYLEAIQEFSKLNCDKSAYMSVICHAKLGNKEEALGTLRMYEQIIQKWQKSEEKELAEERIEKLKTRLK